MAFNEPYPAKYINGVNGNFLIKCNEYEADLWIIEIGWSGKSCIIEMPDKKTARLCMKHFVLKYESGNI